MTEPAGAPSADSSGATASTAVGTTQRTGHPREDRTAEPRHGDQPGPPGFTHGKGGHGSNPAAWVLVAILLAGFVVWAIGMVTGPEWTLVWIGAALVPVGVLVGWVLSRTGHGAPRH